LSEKLRPHSFTRVFSSDLQRTRRTAQAIAEPYNLPIRSLNSLREIAFGSWEGLNWDEVVIQDSAQAQRWVDNYPHIAAPGGEAFDDFSQRIQGAMEAIADEIAGGCAVVVTHAGVIRTFLENVAGTNGNPAEFAKCDYTSCWQVMREQGRWTFLNELTPEATCQAVATRPMSDGGHRF
jgi:broad specificity phosphatase PhoE